MKATPVQKPEMKILIYPLQHRRLSAFNADTKALPLFAGAPLQDHGIYPRLYLSKFRHRPFDPQLT